MYFHQICKDARAKKVIFKVEKPHNMYVWLGEWIEAKSTFYISSDSVGKINELIVQICGLDVPHSDKAVYCKTLNSPHVDREHVQRSTPPIAIYQNSKHQTCWRIPKGE